MRVLIVGGGTVGAFLANILREKNEVTVVEQNLERAGTLDIDMEDVRVIAEDGCEPWVLEMAGVKDTSLVLAATGDDEDNLVVAYLSKFEYDVPQVIGRVNNPVNRWLFNKAWGVDVEVSTPDIMAKIVEEETTLGEVVTVMKLQASDIGLVEITLTADSPALGRKLSDLNLPPETLIVTVVKGEAMVIPTAGTMLEAGDRILAMANVRNQEELDRVLGHK